MDKAVHVIKMSVFCPESVNTSRSYSGRGRDSSEQYTCYLSNRPYILEEEVEGKKEDRRTDKNLNIWIINLAGAYKKEHTLKTPFRPFQFLQVHPLIRLFHMAPDNQNLSIYSSGISENQNFRRENEVPIGCISNNASINCNQSQISVSMVSTSWKANRKGFEYFTCQACQRQFKKNIHWRYQFSPESNHDVTWRREAPQVLRHHRRYFRLHFS